MAQNWIIDLRAFHYSVPAGRDFSERHARKYELELRAFHTIARRWDRFFRTRGYCRLTESFLF